MASNACKDHRFVDTVELPPADIAGSIYLGGKRIDE